MIRLFAKGRRRGTLGDVLTVALLVGLMAAVSLLPADTSLALVQRSGTLKACVPQSYPVLVAADPEAPGFDVSLLQELAARLDLRLELNRNPQMGQDFNPRNWRVNRAQCEVLAGGVVDSPTTRSFLEILPTGLETGWALLLPPGAAVAAGDRIGVYPGLGGLDRLALSSYLRENGVAGGLRPSLQALAEGLAAGEYVAGATESLGARQLAAGRPDWEVRWLPAELGRFSLGLGLWKGDLTLKRSLGEAIAAMERDGSLGELRHRYGIGEIAGELRLGS